MTYRGHVRNGVVVLNDPGHLPDGAEVEVRPVGAGSHDPAAKPIWDEFAEVLADVPPQELAKLPRDASEQHDHYTYGTPKKSP